MSFAIRLVAVGFSTKSKSYSLLGSAGHSVRDSPSKERTVWMNK